MHAAECAYIEAAFRTQIEVCSGGVRVIDVTAIFSAELPACLATRTVVSAWRFRSVCVVRCLQPATRTKLTPTLSAMNRLDMEGSSV